MTVESKTKITLRPETTFYAYLAEKLGAVVYRQRFDRLIIGNGWSRREIWIMPDLSLKAPHFFQSFPAGSDYICEILEKDWNRTERRIDVATESLHWHDEIVRLAKCYEKEFERFKHQHTQAYQVVEGEVKIEVIHHATSMDRKRKET